MKKQILLLAAMLVGSFAGAQTVQEGTVTMGPSYANQVYFKFGTPGVTNAYPHSSWDVAFYRKNTFAFATRVNDAKGIEVYQASNTVSNWATIDVSQVGNWTRLYNSDIEWTKGAFDYGTATYGWGEYNPANHHVTGAIIFVLKYPNGTYKKFKIDDFFGGYTFTYATWNAGTSTWGADQTKVVANTTNPNDIFNYFSLETDAAVTAEPASADWDLIFTKFTTDYPMGGTTTKYQVTGALHHPDVKVAKNVEPGGVMNTANLNFVSAINTIGYDWKTFTGTTYTIDGSKAYYVKLANGTVYRVVFTTFAGSSTGVIKFNYQDVTNSLGTVSFEDKIAFGIYPNPSLDKKINLIYDIKENMDANSKVSIYSMTGAKVFETTIETAQGFYSRELDLSALGTGIYILNLESGSNTITKKVILK